MLAPFDDIDDLLRQTRVMLAPSLWAEARSRMILEAMSRGIPVMASDVGGLAEAMLGMDYLLPVNPVARYRPMVDELMVPAVEIPPQDVRPWAAVLERPVDGPRALRASVVGARAGCRARIRVHLNAAPFEDISHECATAAPQRRSAIPPQRGRISLSDERRRLLALRVKRANIHVGP